MTPLKKKLDEFGSFLSKVWDHTIWQALEINKAHFVVWLLLNLWSEGGGVGGRFPVWAFRTILQWITVYQLNVSWSTIDGDLHQVIAVVCILVWVVNIGHFRDPAHGGILRGAIHYFKVSTVCSICLNNIFCIGANSCGIHAKQPRQILKQFSKELGWGEGSGRSRLEEKSLYHCR